jgi:hypothetical protein
LIYNMFKIGGQYNKAVEMYAAAKNYNKEQQQIIHMSKRIRKLIHYMNYEFVTISL